MSLPVIIVGSGGHAAVVADALLAAEVRVLGFVDTDPARRGTVVCGLPVLGDEAVLDGHTPGTTLLANGIGGVAANGLRRSVQERLESHGWEFVTVRHPAAIVSHFAHLAASAQVLAGAIVQANAHVGRAAIVNTGAIVEHDVELGDFSHVAPRALLCGSVAVGAGSHIGAGAVVRQRITLGAQTTVGAGAVVVADFPAAGRTLVGTPAREAA
jgi:sugar O-acyltransferase (sialic acid O-acetyltransferase NeuD family)